MNNKNVYGSDFSDEIVKQVWEKGTDQSGSGGTETRKDECGATMRRGYYGNTDEKEGWEVDHIMPKSKGGDDNLSNLQPLQWENNRHKGDDYPEYECKNK